MPHLQRPTVQLSYTVAGSGPTIVLLHGWCDDARTWEPVIDALASEYCCIAPDLRGHGGSGIPTDHAFSFEALTNDIAAICAHERVESAVLVGHSYGAILAGATALRHPALARGLVLLDQSYELGVLQAQLAPIETTIRSVEHHLAFRTAFLGGLLGSVAGAARDRLETAIATTPPEVAMALWAPLFEMTVGELDAFSASVLSPLDRVPSIVLDRERVPGYHDRLQARHATARLEFVPGGHWVQLEHPDRIATAVRSIDASA